jgi:hypothetical protein
MASVHKSLVIFVFYIKAMPKVQIFVPNICWISDEKMGGRKYNCCNISYKTIASLPQKNSVISDDFVIALEPDI